MTKCQAKKIERKGRIRDYCLITTSCGSYRAQVLGS